MKPFCARVPVSPRKPAGEALTALVTGGSSGIGKAIAAGLAARGSDLVLVSERRDDLELAVREIAAKSPVSVTPIEADLSSPSTADRVYETCAARGIRVGILVNCAGIYVNREEEMGERPGHPGGVETLLALHVTSLTRLCLLFGRDMAARREGYILNVSSISAFFPDPASLTYGPSKRYVLALSESLHCSWKDRNVKVSCLIPGGVDTGFFARNRVFVPPMVSSRLMSPERCAGIALRAMFGGRTRVTAGWTARFHLVLFRLILAPPFCTFFKRVYVGKKRRAGM